MKPKKGKIIQLDLFDNQDVILEEKNNTDKEISVIKSKNIILNPKEFIPEFRPWEKKHVESPDPSDDLPF